MKGLNITRIISKSDQSALNLCRVLSKHTLAVLDKQLLEYFGLLKHQCVPI